MSLILSSAPHIKTADTTQRLMLNVIIALLPCAIAGICFFGLSAAIVIAVAVVSAVAAEFIWQKLAHQKVRVGDCIATPAEGALGAAIHASISGRVAAAGERIVIEKE